MRSIVWPKFSLARERELTRTNADSTSTDYTDYTDSPMLSHVLLITDIPLVSLGASSQTDMSVARQLQKALGKLSVFPKNHYTAPFIITQQPSNLL